MPQDGDCEPNQAHGLSWLDSTAGLTSMPNRQWRASVYHSACLVLRLFGHDNAWVSRCLKGWCDFWERFPLYLLGLCTCVRPAVGEALPLRADQGQGSALLIAHTERDAVAVADRTPPDSGAGTVQSGADRRSMPRLKMEKEPSTVLVVVRAPAVQRLYSSLPWSTAWRSANSLPIRR